MPAVASSISGYWTEIGSPQPRQRARRRIHEITGTLSCQASPLPHRGHREDGFTTDCFGSAPHRRIHTLRKLPNTAPNNAAMTISNPAGSSACTGDLVQQDPRSHRHVQGLDSPRQWNGNSPVGRTLEQGADTGPLIAEHERNWSALGAPAGQPVRTLAADIRHPDLRPLEPAPGHELVGCCLNRG